MPEQQPVVRTPKQQRRRDRQEQRGPEPFLTGGRRTNLQRLARAQGLSFGPKSLTDDLDPTTRRAVDASRIPNVFTRGFGTAIANKAASRLTEAQNSRQQDLNAQLSQTFGLGSGIAADARRQNSFQESSELSNLLTDLEIKFREARAQEQLQRALTLLRFLEGAPGQERFGQQPEEGFDFAGLASGLGSVAGSFFGPAGTAVGAAAGQAVAPGGSSVFGRKG